MNRQKIFIVVITLMMLIASAQIVCAEDDILSGVFHGVNWRITSEHELIIGKDGYNQEFDYIDPDDDLDWPWKDALLTSCRFEGNVISNGALDYMFYDCNSLKSIDFTNLSTSNTTSLEGLFENCNKLASINFADIDTSKVIDFSGMFDNCKSLSNIDLSQFDTSQAVGFSSMFRDCDSLSNIDLSKLDTSKAESMDFMFSGCGQITELDVSGFDTSNVRFMGSMFESIPYLTTLDLSNFDTSNVVHMGWMFRGCFRLKNLNISSFDTKNVLYMTQMFDGCEDLESLDVSSFDTSNVLNMELLFSRCTHLKELDLSSFDMSSVTNASGMIQRYNLKTLITPRNVNLDIPLGGVMYDLNGGQYSALPKNGPSMVLVRDEPVYIVNNNVTEEMLYGEYAYYLNNRAFKSIVGKLADVEYEIIWNRVSNHLTLSALKTTLRQGAGKNFITFLTHLNGKTPHEDELEEEIARELMLTVQGNDDTLTEVIEFSNQNFTWMDFAYSLPKNFYKFDSEIKKLVDKYAEMSGKSKTYSEKAVKNILKGQKKYSDTSDDIIDLAQYGIDAGDAIIAGLATEQINEATVDYLLN
ncbi:MAG: BspA family leucine-rich repeat surface protein, partial [Firmicutes bacterium]|nr:BspA family leucine-rich repeat surface protein [Bacillota bacterium]